MSHPCSDPFVHLCACGGILTDITEADDLALGLRVWLCPGCKAEPVEAEADPAAYPLDDQPTMALPGSLEKMRVLCRRLGRGQALFHPRDATGTCLRPGEQRGRRTNHARDLPTGISRARSRYRARLYKDGQEIDLGLFLTVCAAAEALRLYQPPDDDRISAS